MFISSDSVLVFVETEAVVSRAVFVATFFFFFAVKGSGSGEV